MQRFINGPLIPGTSVPSWWLRQERLYEQRPKPLGAVATLSNPTWLLSSRSFTRNEPATDSNGWIGAPEFSLDFQDTFIPQSIRNELKAKTATKIRGKIKDEKWNLFTFMGELPTTLKYFRQALSEIVRVYSSVKRGDLRSMRRLAKRGRAYLRRRGLAGTVKDGSGKLAKRWLEFRYAISPLVYDVQDMLAYVYKASTRPIIRRAAAGDRTRWTQKVNGGKDHMDVVHTYDIQGRGVVYFTVNPRSEAFKQLGLINLVAGLWELAPLSFVVDMFLPVGDKLAGLDAMAGVTLYGATYSESISGSSVGIEKTLQFPGSGGYTMTTGSSSCEAKWYNRTTGFSFIWKPPTYSEHPSVKQMFDLTALTRTILLK